MRFVILILAALGLAAPVAAQGFAAGRENVLAAMRAEMESIPGAIVTELPDYTKVEVPDQRTTYYLTKPGHYAHPAALGLALFPQPDGTSIPAFTTSWPYALDEAPDSIRRWVAELSARP